MCILQLHHFYLHKAQCRLADCRPRSYARIHDGGNRRVDIGSRSRERVLGELIARRRASDSQFDVYRADRSKVDSLTPTVGGRVTARVGFPQRAVDNHIEHVIFTNERIDETGFVERFTRPRLVIESAQSATPAVHRSTAVPRVESEHKNVRCRRVNLNADLRSRIGRSAYFSRQYKVARNGFAEQQAVTGELPLAAAAIVYSPFAVSVFVPCAAPP